MTNPQKENGYTPICNELLEAIYSSPFNATQLKILMVVCRYTYGFSRKEHSISESFISKAVNISKRYISSELNKLVEQKVITIVKAHTDTASRVLSLNKHYDEWICKTVQQVNNTSTGEQLISTTGEQYINTPVEQLFHQDKQNLKQNLKQVVAPKKILPLKTKYAERVSMIPDEYSKLITQYSKPIIDNKIIDLDLWKGSKGKSTKSDYLTLLAWLRKDNPIIEPNKGWGGLKHFE